MPLFMLLNHIEADFKQYINKYPNQNIDDLILFLIVQYGL